MAAGQMKSTAESFLKVWEFELPGTVKVLGRVKDNNRDYRPDAKSRTAWQLATHLATSDVWFLDSIISRRFVFDPEHATKAEGQFTDVGEIVTFYEREVPARIARVRAMSGDTLAQPVDFFGFVQWPVVEYLGLACNHSMHHRGQLTAYLRPSDRPCPLSTAAAPTNPQAEAHKDGPAFS